MQTTIIERKYRLIDQIIHLKNEKSLSELEDWLSKNEKSVLLNKLTKPMAKTLDIAKLKKEKGYNELDRKEFDRIIYELDIQEPIDLLLSQIRK